ncbi:MAG TPA: A/G-specific adenine glycosylase [Candidatus Sulfotelmatobacter sp.]|nr:A/G-specific adenine glycosylase [Candidatus Sulfotelmatobacter sp.]
MLHGAQLPRFRKQLLAWFAQFQRELPWRRSKDPYRIWLSEIMLQQTRVAAVIPYYERFLERFPTVQALAKAPEEEVLRHWAGLGYYSRARNLQKAARQIVAVHSATFPATLEKALELSGIGAYTAAAILSIAYGEKLAVLDGNVARVLARLGAIRGDLRSGGRWQQLQKAADELLAPEAPGDWNQAMMELGATLCTPRSPQCLLCPVGEFCRARKLGLSDAIPETRKKREAVEIALAALVLVDKVGRTLLLPPPAKETRIATTHKVAALLSRMWHFPTSQVDRDALKGVREFAKNTGLIEGKLASKLIPLTKVRHTVTYRQITVFPYRLNVVNLPQVPQAKAFPLDDLSAVPVSNLTRKVALAALAHPPKGRKTNSRSLRLCS